MFREINIPILSELVLLGQQFGVISGKMTVEVEGKEYTLQQAAKFLENHDQQLREEVYRKINERRLQDKDALNSCIHNLFKKDNRWPSMQASAITAITNLPNWAGLIIQKKIVSSFMIQ